MTIKFQYTSLSLRKLTERFNSTYYTLLPDAVNSNALHIAEEGHDYTGELNNKIFLTKYNTPPTSPPSRTNTQHNYLSARKASQPILTALGALSLVTDQTEERSFKALSAVMAICWRFDVDYRNSLYSISTLSLTFLLLKINEEKFHSANWKLIRVILASIFNSHESIISITSDKFEINFTNLRFRGFNVTDFSQLQQLTQISATELFRDSPSQNTKEQIALIFSGDRNNYAQVTNNRIPRGPNYFLGNLVDNEGSTSPRTSRNGDEPGPLYTALNNNFTRNFLISYAQVDVMNFLSCKPSVFATDDRDIISALKSLSSDIDYQRTLTPIIKSIDEALVKNGS
jgi:hypothetical protein